MGGAFISFEGIDGSGKTTQLLRLEETLRAKNHPVVVAQEPGGTRVGAQIRRLLLDAANRDLRPIPELLLYFASRAQNIEEVIRPALEAGKIVLVDRFTDATVAYQGYGRGLGVQTVRTIERIACQGIEPHLTLWLDVDPRIGLARALRRNDQQEQNESRMEQESLGFYERVRHGYEEIHRQDAERVRRIDAHGTVDEVSVEVKSVVETFFENRAAGRLL